LRKRIGIVFVCCIYLFAGRCFAFEKGDERFYVAVKAFSDGFYQASLSLFERFIQDYPESKQFYEAKLYLAKCYYQLEDYSKAIDVLMQLELERDMHTLLEEVYYWESIIYFKGRDFKNSLRYARKIQEDYPESRFKWWAYYLVANNDTELSKRDEAIAFYKRKIDETDNSELIDNAYAKLFSLYFSERKNSLIAGLAKKYLQKYPDGHLRAKVYFYLGESYSDQENWQEALTNYKYALTEKPDKELRDLIYQGFGFSYIVLGNHVEGKLNIDKIENPELRLFSQAVYYVKTKKTIEALETVNLFIRNYPESKFIALAYLNKADLLYEMGRVNDAIATYNTILTTFNKPQHAKTINKARYGLAWCHLKIGHFKEAINEFKRASEQTDSMVVKISSQIQIADTYQETGAYDQALQTYNDILKNYPNTIYSDYIQFQIGITFLKKKELDKALFSLRNLKRSFPRSKLIPQAQYYLAVGYFSQENYGEAKSLLEDFIQRFPQSDFMAKAYYLYGKCFYNEGDYQRALDNFKMAAEKYKDKQIQEFVYIDIGHAYFSLDMFDKAKKTWSDFLVRFPESSYRSSVALYLGGLYEKENQYIEAEKYYLKVVDEEPQTPWGYEALLSLGHLYWGMKDLDKAEEYFRQLSEKNTPLAMKGKLYLAEILSKKGDAKEAFVLYDQLIASGSSVSKIALVSKATLFRERQDYRQAAKFFQKAIDEGVNSPDILFSLGLCLEKMNKNDEAIEQYFKIIYMFSSDDFSQQKKDFSYYKTRSYFRIARLYEKDDKFDQARQIYERIVELGVKESKIAEARLEELNR